MTAKKLLPGQLRFVPRLVDKLWRVYDVGNASFPYRTGELGEVLQDVEKESEAQLEADRLEALVAPAPAKPKATKKTGRSKTVQAEDVPAEEQEEILEAPEAYEMSDNQKKKHEEEILSGKY